MEDKRNITEKNNEGLNKKMKIAMIVPSLENKGPVIVARDIALNNENKNIEFIFISLRKNSFESLKNFSKFRIYELNLGKIPLFSLKLRKIIKKINPDIIHCHCFYPTVITGLYLKEYYNKIISTLHNNPLEDFLYEYGKTISFFMVKMMSFFQKRFYLNISISDYIKNIHKKIGVNNVAVIYNGVPCIEGNYKNFYEKSKKMKLITASVLIKRKNINFLIDVSEKLKDLEIEYELNIIGDGAEKEYLKELVLKKKLEKNIKFLGKISREEVYKELFKSDIFLFSSKSEGFGLAVVEALMCRLPVVTSNIPVMEEIIENDKNGVICNFNVNEYVNAILKIYKDLDEYKRNTQKYFNENFLSKKMSENYVKIYEEIFKN